MSLFDTVLCVCDGCLFSETGRSMFVKCVCEMNSRVYMNLYVRMPIDAVPNHPKDLWRNEFSMFSPYIYSVFGQIMKIPCHHLAGVLKGWITVRSVRLENSTLWPLPNYHEPPVTLPTESLNLKLSFGATIMSRVYSCLTFSLPPTLPVPNKTFPQKSWEVPVSVATFMGSLSSAAWRIIITPVPW